MKLIAIDMDGTLLRGDKSFDLERFERAVHALKKPELVFVLPLAIAILSCAATSINNCVRNCSLPRLTAMPLW